MTPSLDMAARIRRAIDERDMPAFGALLADDARWGDDDDHPRSCRNRNQVLSTFSRLLDEGAHAEVFEVAAGTEGVLCGLDVQWTDNVSRADDRHLYHVYLVRDDKITEIRRFDDRSSAAEAAGLLLRGRDSNSQPSG